MTFTFAPQIRDESEMSQKSMFIRLKVGIDLRRAKNSDFFKLFSDFFGQVYVVSVYINIGLRRGMQTSHKVDFFYLRPL